MWVRPVHPVPGSHKPAAMSLNIPLVVKDNACKQQLMRIVEGLYELGQGEQV